MASRGASVRDVRQAYLALARAHHPDKGGSAFNFVRIGKAYEACLEAVQSRAPLEVPQQAQPQSSQSSSASTQSTAPASRPSMPDPRRKKAGPSPTAASSSTRTSSSRPVGPPRAYEWVGSMRSPGFGVGFEESILRTAPGDQKPVTGVWAKGNASSYATTGAEVLAAAKRAEVPVEDGIEAIRKWKAMFREAYQAERREQEEEEMRMRRVIPSPEPLVAARGEDISGPVRQVLVPLEEIGDLVELLKQGQRFQRSQGQVFLWLGMDGRVLQWRDANSGIRPEGGVRIGPGFRVDLKKKKNHTEPRTLLIPSAKLMVDAPTGEIASQWRDSLEALASALEQRAGGTKEIVLV